MGRLLLTLALVALPGLSSAGEAEDLRDRVLASAAKDADTLKKVRSHVLKAKGTRTTGSAPMPATFEMTGVWPGKTKMTWEFGDGTMKGGMTLCAADDRGWKAGYRAPSDSLNIEELNDFRADAYAVWVTTLMPLADPANKFTPVAPVAVGGRPAVGFKVSRRPWPDLTLYFDKETLALRRMTYSTRDAGIMASREMLFDGHKVIDGIRLPTKQTLSINGKESLVWTDMAYTFPDKIDPKEFEKP